LRPILGGKATNHASGGLLAKALGKPKSNCDQGSGVTEPNELDELRQRRELQEHRRWGATRVINVLTVLVLAAIAALVLKMILY
jgi:hypothetical protein